MLDYHWTLRRREFWKSEKLNHLSAMENCKKNQTNEKEKKKYINESISNKLKISGENQRRKKLLAFAPIKLATTM